MGDALRYTEDYMPAQSVSGGWLPNSTIGDLKISKDGNVMILGVHQGGMRTWVSQDAGANWTDLHTSGILSGQSTIRVEYAISDFKNADLSFASLLQSNFEGGRLTGTNLNGADLEKANFKIEYEKLTECFIFLNSGGVTSKTKCIPLNNFFLNLLNKIDRMLVKLFPKIFCMGRRLVLIKN